MSKAGNILLLVVVFFAMAGTNHKTQAYESTNTSSCASKLVSTPLCEEIESQTCREMAEQQEEPKQVQIAVVIAEAKTEPAQTSLATTTIVLPTITPQQAQGESDSTELNSERIFELVNQYRTSQDLAPFERDDKVCELTQARSSELGAELNNGTIHSGLYGRGLPYWIFENAKVGSNEEGTVAWWISSPLHHQSIVGDYKFSCARCTGNHCSQLFTSFSPK